MWWAGFDNEQQKLADKYIILRHVNDLDGKIKWIGPLSGMEFAVTKA